MAISADDMAAFPDVDAASFEPLDLPPLNVIDEGDQDPQPKRRGRPPGSKNRTASGAAPRPSGRPSKAQTEAQLAGALADPLTKLAAAVSFALPTTGAVLGARAHITSTALVRYAADKPRMLAALRKVSNVGPAAELVETLAMVIIAAQLDLGNLPAEHPLPTLTGVSAIHLEIRGHMADVQREKEMEDLMAMGGPFATPPPGWNPMSPMGDPTNPMFSFSAKPGAAARN